ncbi:MAG TPA: hypothetical protein VEA41_20115, partial [Salinarimonas sp.]|nr:hypothetical protein [Salinarimonas sp.]
VPALIEEIQRRVRPDTRKSVWCWESLDVRDLDNPAHRILSADRKEDLTELFLGSDKSGSNYQYRDATDRPFLPIPMYHAERTGKLWDSFYGLEAVLGTLTVGVLLTFWIHGVKDGSFATVYLVNGRVTGAEIETPEGARQQVISAEPGSVIEVAPIEEGLQPTVIQVQPGMDPEKLMSAIGMFEAGLAEYAGVSAADLVRTGADPRSGVSLSISREGLRAAQARAAPQLRRGDAELLATAAKVLNRAKGTAYPESGYSPTYPALPLSSAEVAALREDILAKVAAGLESKVDGYMRLHPGTDRDQAIAQLKRIALENAMFPGTAVPAPHF